MERILLSIKKVLSIFYPVFKVLGKFGVGCKVEKKLYLYSLLRKPDFYSEMQYNIQIARDLGVTVGDNCRILGGVSFSTEPYLVELGDNVIVTGGVKFDTHDGSVMMCRDMSSDIVGHFGRIKIGSNCFVGNEAMFMPNVEIGENSIIAARSLVIDSFPPNSVIMGNPAKLIFKTDMLKKMKLHSPNTIKNSEYAYPFEEDIPADIRKEMILSHVGDLPIRRPRK